MIPIGFCSLENIPFDIRYATHNNFMGRPIAGYTTNKCIVSNAVRDALILAQEKATKAGYSLIVFEAYRPLKAVEDIVQWSLNTDIQNKERFYPDIDKDTLFDLGYIALRSTHTRGAAVDVTLINPTTKEELDMGTEFDFFGSASHTISEDISASAKTNRHLLLSIMESSGFVNYDKEWWHFTLKDEPFPNTYFDFDIA
ncbi:M15 family metallopeptidase [Candidatus Bodocaedibacter vickermanii]|uniref:D-alanyl-D-alanine dipeptidase n=1 Tax=Candidatus Bodocaedibacter vickermanii TaxID=2741701 RepID=A0A7L9RU22_9PROT|nr:D-alanyl-D-alanine dipeptidase [Candidatus Paracaedibacteraceae bacterium 'Lake Konstanz']